LWLAAQQSGVWEVLTSQWPEPRSGPSPAHYLLRAAIHRICQPGPKTEVEEWYRHSILSSLWGFPAERFTSQEFWDCLDRIQTGDDGENRLSLCHHVYAGNIADAEEFPVALKRVVALLDQHGLVRDTVTLVIDKGSAALANTLELEQARIGWISALPWNQAPQEFRERAVEQL